MAPDRCSPAGAGRGRGSGRSRRARGGEVLGLAEGRAALACRPGPPGVSVRRPEDRLCPGGSAPSPERAPGAQRGRAGGSGTPGNSAGQALEGAPGTRSARLRVSGPPHPAPGWAPPPPPRASPGLPGSPSQPGSPQGSLALPGLPSPRLSTPPGSRARGPRPHCPPSLPLSPGAGHNKRGLWQAGGCGDCLPAWSGRQDPRGPACSPGRPQKPLTRGGGS